MTRDVAPVISIGFVGCLSGFAGNYGTEALNGARLAVQELKDAGVSVNLHVEDDATVMKNTVSAYKKLTAVNKIDLLIGGTWWADSIVKLSERDKIPFISVETLYSRDTVIAPNYFMLQGDLKNWVKVFDPVVRDKGIKRGAIVRYVSGFGATLTEAMQELFMREGREFVGAVEYSDIDLVDATSIVLKLKLLRADAVYLDMQPSALANFVKKMQVLGLSITVFTHSVASDLFSQHLLDPLKIEKLYYTERQMFKESFAEKYRKAYGKEPLLNSDLGYYAVFIGAKALSSGESINALKAGNYSKDGFVFRFDERNLLIDLRHTVYEVDRSEPKILY